MSYIDGVIDKVMLGNINRKSVLYFFSGCVIYGLANYYRWFQWDIFHSSGAYGVQHPSILEVVSIFVMLAMPLIFVSSVLYALFSRLKEYLSILAFSLILFLFLVFMELDLSWYQLSRQHVTLNDVLIFLSEDWKLHFGIRDEDILRNTIKISVHFVAILMILIVALLLGMKTNLSIPLVTKKTFFTLVFTIGLIDIFLTGAFISEDRKQWAMISEKNFIRISFFDAAVAGFIRNDGDSIGNAKERIEEIWNAEGGAPILEIKSSANKAYSAPKIAGIEKVVLLVVEGFSGRYVDSETMPYLMSLKENSYFSDEHYSSGNSTHYGILGLTFGLPLDFYEGDSLEQYPQSEFIDAFNQSGYKTYFYAADITGHRQMEAYLDNFSGGLFAAKDDDDVVDVFVDDFQDVRKTFQVVYYVGTHYPYSHKKEFSYFQPEVPDDFDYSAFNAIEYKEQIQNRYRNCLSQLDAWLRTILSGVDLSETLLIITGDHGEEFYEEGRLSHSSHNVRPQTVTPLIIFSPELARKNINMQSSHLDIMPTISAVLGVAYEEERYIGQNLLDNDMGAGEGGAIIATNNHTNKPVQWAVVKGDRKIILETTKGGVVGLTRLLDSRDKPQNYNDDPQSWDDVFYYSKFLYDRLSKKTAIQ